MIARVTSIGEIAMPRPRPPHLNFEHNRHGTPVWFVRIGKGPRTRIRAEFGTPEFDEAYQAAIQGQPRPQKASASAGSLAWLIERYRETTAWSTLSAATRRQRENIFLHVLETAGTTAANKVTAATINAGKERRKDTPSQARNFLDAMRGLFRWAVKAKHVKTDPTLGIDNPPRKKGPGFPVWSEEDVQTYERHWGPGTRQFVWLQVLLYTGARRGDAHAIGRQHIRGNEISFRTEKSQRQVEVTLPLLPPLRAAVERGPCGDLTFICGERGSPLTKESFGNMFSAAARAAGVKKSAHGVRKIAATRCAEAGATVHELNALFGWSGTTMAMEYTKAAERRRLSMAAGSKLLGTPDEHSIPAPSYQVRAASGKAK